MTDLLEDAVATARRLSPERRDEIAHVVLAMLDDDPAIDQLSPEEAADLEASDAEVARGELATDEQMRAIWAKHSL